MWKSLSSETFGGVWLIYSTNKYKPKYKWLIGPILNRSIDAKFIANLTNKRYTIMYLMSEAKTFQFHAYGWKSRLLMNHNIIVYTNILLFKWHSARIFCKLLKTEYAYQKTFKHIVVFIVLMHWYWWYLILPRILCQTGKTSQQGLYKCTNSLSICANNF